ncbi:MATE efflux family protein [Segniliparus rotundus DSM 44985]|uniref:Probable multidrug resistance protein NorM n=1 Tax=Segniliparus rotundus (strain ATCC BAA-972 / CDC 1076 / CIP 108378 / DSM 44985 / JCM 13578) TaxID=640132 RepID=D6ZBD6_SEGRD|nr:MATE family efflux transporter [Segniliparus rotundus]ADG98888.1 MATE efflux family protein [Segniliparus rotundus DSM 44985]
MRTTGLPTLREGRTLAVLAAPIAGIQLAQVALTTTDLAMMGLLSVQAIAAGGLAIAIYNQIRMMCIAVTTAVGNLVAGSVGRGEARTGQKGLDGAAETEIRRLVRAGLLVATMVGMFGVLSLVVVSFGLSWLGQAPQIQRLAQPMVLTLSCGLIPSIWLDTLRQFAVGMRRPGSLLWVTIASVVVNASLNAMFIYGWFGVPRLGLAGIGLSTATVNIVTLVAFWAMVRRDKTLSPLFSPQAWRARKDDVLAIVRLGAPITLIYGSETAIFTLCALLMGRFGPDVLAAHNVVFQLTYIVFQVSVGLSHGSSILISRALGHADPGQARRIAQTALAAGGCVMTAVAAIYLALPDLVLTPFLDARNAAAVLPIARTLLLVGVIEQFFDCWQNVSVGLLRGLGDTKSGFRITLLGYWAVGLPTVLTLAYGLDFGGVGVWLGLCAGLATTAALLYRRFHQKLAELEQSVEAVQ